MRLSILAFALPEQGGIYVASTLDGVEQNRVHLSDRAANGEAFIGEHVVRLPRRLTRGRKPLRAALADLIGSKHHWV